jgi:hypothetical protein
VDETVSSFILNYLASRSKYSNMEIKEQCQIKISSRFAALYDSMDISRTWESIKRISKIQPKGV